MYILSAKLWQASKPIIMQFKQYMYDINAAKDLANSFKSIYYVHEFLRVHNVEWSAICVTQGFHYIWRYILYIYMYTADIDCLKYEYNCKETC